MDKMQLDDKDVERIEQSRKQFQVESRESGLESGRSWARESAEFQDLYRLSAWKDKNPDGFQYGDDCAELVMVAICGPEWNDKGIAEITEETVFGPYVNDLDGVRRNCEYFDGFVSGAVEVFDALPPEEKRV